MSEGLKVLVVEDVESSMRVMNCFLNKLGVEMRGAWNAEEAIRIFKAQDFDGILMDINLPDGDGIDLADKLVEIAKSNGKSKPPVVVVSSVYSVDERDNIKAFMRKPLALPTLKKVISYFRSFKDEPATAGIEFFVDG